MKKIVKRRNDKTEDSDEEGIVRLGNSLIRILRDCNGEILIQNITNVCDCCGCYEAVHTYQIEPEDCGDGDVCTEVAICEECLASP